MVLYVSNKSEHIGQAEPTNHRIIYVSREQPSPISKLLFSINSSLTLQGFIWSVVGIKHSNRRNKPFNVSEMLILNNSLEMGDGCSQGI